MPSPELRTMSIIILHRIPYQKVRYHEVIDHDLHDVHYVITNQGNDIPTNLRHKKIYVPCKDYTEEVIGEVIRNKINPDKVIALSEYNLIAAEIIRSSLSMEAKRGNERLQSVYRCRDKRQMKRSVEKANIPIAKSIAISSREDLNENNFDFHKFIIKPAKGASSENTRMLKTREELFLDDELISSIGNNEPYIAEEFVDGDIYHFDGLVVGGVIKFFLGSHYVGNCLDFANGHPLGSVQLADDHEYFDWVERCIKAVGINNGAFHLEGVQGEHGMVFLEVGNRAGGAGVVECTERALGINLMQEEVRLSILGDKYRPPNIRKERKCYGWFVVPSASFNTSTKSLQILKDKFPEIVSLNINIHPDRPGSISYAEEHNPCTGSISSDSHLRGVKVIEELFQEVS